MDLVMQRFYVAVQLAPKKSVEKQVQEAIERFKKRFLVDPAFVIHGPACYPGTSEIFVPSGCVYLALPADSRERSLSGFRYATAQP